MTKHIQLIIPEPCHESWDKMAPVEQGKFCASCQKKVIDFTGMSDEKLAAFFRKPDTSVCGRFQKEQLEKDLVIPRKRISWVKYFFQIALPAVLFSYKGYTQQVKGKVLAKPNTVLTEQENKSTEKDTETQEPSKRVLSGRIVDAEGQGISYASIWVENTLQGTATDGAGYFRLTIKMDSVIMLRVSHIGYEARNILFDPANGDSVPIIQLQRKELTGVLGFVITVKKQPSVIPKRISKIIPATMDTESPHFKVFPNPAPQGGSLNIELINKLKEGYYDMLVTSFDGKRAFQKKIWIDAEAKVMNVELPLISAGNYIVSLKNKKNGKVFGEKLVIR